MASVISKPKPIRFNQPVRQLSETTMKLVGMDITISAKEEQFDLNMNGNEKGRQDDCNGSDTKSDNLTAHCMEHDSMVLVSQLFKRIKNIMITGFDTNVTQLIGLVYDQLRNHGMDLDSEISSKEELDDDFNILRNILFCVDSDGITNARILHLLEIRARGWQRVESIERYYHEKIEDMKRISQNGSEKSIDCKVETPLNVPTTHQTYQLGTSDNIKNRSYIYDRQLLINISKLPLSNSIPRCINIIKEKMPILVRATSY